MTWAFKEVNEYLKMITPLHEALLILAKDKNETTNV